MKWILANWSDILIALTSIVAAASVIAKLTPTKTDDKYVGYALKIIDFLALNNEPTKTSDKK